MELKQKQKGEKEEEEDRLEELRDYEMYRRPISDRFLQTAFIKRIGRDVQARIDAGIKRGKRLKWIREEKSRNQEIIKELDDLLKPSYEAKIPKEPREINYFLPTGTFRSLLNPHKAQ